MIRNFREMDIYLYINEILFKFLGSPGTPSSSPPAPYSSSTQPRNGGSGGGKLPDENSNMAVQVDRHDSISPASMDSSIQEDERAHKSKANQSSNFYFYFRRVKLWLASDLISFLHSAYFRILYYMAMSLDVYILHEIQDYYLS